VHIINDIIFRYFTFL